MSEMISRRRNGAGFFPMSRHAPTLQDLGFAICVTMFAQSRSKISGEFTIEKLSKDVEIKSKDVTRILRKFVYPLLKEQGFDDWTTRKAWRRRGRRIDHIEFRGFNDYNAAMLECTTASLSIWIGTSLPSLGYKDSVKFGKKGPRPEECQMPIRGMLGPSENFGKKAFRTEGVWVIESENDAKRAALDINGQLHDHGLRWLNRDFGIDELLELLIRETPSSNLEVIGNSLHYIDAGNGMCPARHRMIAELAAAKGDYRCAAENYEKARWVRKSGSGESRLIYADYPDQDEELLELSKKYGELAERS